MLKIGAAAAFGFALPVINYWAVSHLITVPLASFWGLVALGFLSLEVGILGLISYSAISYYQKRREIIAACPYYQYYQGNLITPFSYLISHSFIQDKEMMIPLLRKCFNVLGNLDNKNSLING